MPTGSCTCGQLKYSYSQTPVTSILCHCLLCRKVSSSAFAVNIVLPIPAVTITGSPSHFTSGVTLSGTVEPYPLTDGVIADVFKTTFCGTCGSTVVKQVIEANICDKSLLDCVIVEGGTLDNKEDLKNMKIDMELFVQLRPMWLPSSEGAQQWQSLPGK